MFLLFFRRSSDFWKREYLYNVPFWKRALVIKLESDRWSSCCRVISSSFLKFPSHSPIMSSILLMSVTYERVFLAVKLTAGSEKPIWLGGRFQWYLVSQVSSLCHYCKGGEVCITTLLWQNNGRQNGLKLWRLFSKLYKIMMNKVTFVGFRGSDGPNRLFW